MRHSVEPRDRIYVKGYGFLSFVKNIGTHTTKVAKSISNKYSQNLLDSAIKSDKNNKNRCNKICFKNSNSKNCRSNW